MLDKIKSVEIELLKDLEKVSDEKTLEEIRLKYLSRKGLISAFFEDFKTLPKDEKPAVGQSLNVLKNLAESKIKDYKNDFDSKKENKESELDLTLPGRVRQIGSKHLIIQTIDDIKKIFKGLGFSIVEGPELESDYYNFEALNFPSDHPARDMQDTFFISEKFVLRTHTTPVQVRIMEKQKPPIRAIMPGKVFRNEAVSARSLCVFHQVDGIFVDKNVTFAELKGTLVAFAQQYYGADLKYRFRPSFFPFTEPSAEMDITCYICKGKGCRICKGSGWLEILGCGMVDPNVFEAVGYDAEEYSGYAFGMGIERTALLKYGISDIRTFHENDLRFLKQF